MFEEEQGNNSESKAPLGGDKSLCRQQLYTGTRILFRAPSCVIEVPQGYFLFQDLLLPPEKHEKELKEKSSRSELSGESCLLVLLLCARTMCFLSPRNVLRKAPKSKGGQGRNWAIFFLRDLMCEQWLKGKKKGDTQTNIGENRREGRRSWRASRRNSNYANIRKEEKGLCLLLLLL